MTRVDDWLAATRALSAPPVTAHASLHRALQIRARLRKTLRVLDYINDLVKQRPGGVIEAQDIQNTLDTLPD